MKPVDGIPCFRISELGLAQTLIEMFADQVFSATWACWSSDMVS